MKFTLIAGVRVNNRVLIFIFSIIKWQLRIKGVLWSKRVSWFYVFLFTYLFIVHQSFWWHLDFRWIVFYCLLFFSFGIGSNFCIVPVCMDTYIKQLSSVFTCGHVLSSHDRNILETETQLSIANSYKTAMFIHELGAHCKPYTPCSQSNLTNEGLNDSGHFIAFHQDSMNNTATFGWLVGIYFITHL